MHAEHNSLEKSKTVHEGRIRSHAASLIGTLILAAATLAGAAKAQTPTQCNDSTLTTVERTAPIWWSTTRFHD